MGYRRVGTSKVPEALHSFSYCMQLLLEAAHNYQCSNICSASEDLVEQNRIVVVLS